MRIMKDATTSKLPDIITECSGPVYIIHEDGSLFTVNNNTGVLKMFDRLWRSMEKGEVELAFSNPRDVNKILHMMSLV